MNRFKACFFAALFLALTAFKIMCPSVAETMRSKLWSAAQCDMDYTETLTAMGRSFADGSAADELISALGLNIQEKVPAAVDGQSAPGEDA